MMVIVPNSLWQAAKKLGISKNDSLFPCKNNMKMKLGYLFPLLTQQGSLTANKPNNAPMREALMLLRTDHCHYPHSASNTQTVPSNSLLPQPSAFKVLFLFPHKIVKEVIKQSRRSSRILSLTSSYAESRKENK